MKRVSLKKTLLASLLLSTASTSAHAGLSDGINSFFTFREDQKPLVTPNRDLPPLEVVTPSYDERRSNKWSSYYTRDDLEPVKYLDDSSMVMRPHVQKPMNNNRTAQHPQRQGMAYPHGNVHGNGYPQGVQQGYDAIAERDRINRANAARQNNMYIGDAGTSPNNPNYPSGGRVGKQTLIDEPVYSWKDDQGRSGYATPRKGDYDYERVVKHRRAEDVSQEMMGDQGYELTRSTGYYDAEMAMRDRGGQPMAYQGSVDLIQQPAQPAYTQQGAGYAQGGSMGAGTSGSGQMMSGSGSMNGNTQVGLPTNYIVQQDDTLSHISEKDYIYGDWKLWPLIYDANRHQVNDPDLIHPGQDLGIPRDYNNAQEGEARTRATSKTPPFDFYDGM